MLNDPIHRAGSRFLASHTISRQSLSELASSTAALTDETVYALGAALHSLGVPATQQRFALLHPVLFSLWREGATPYQIEHDTLYRSFCDFDSVLIPVVNPNATVLVAVWPQKRVLQLYIANGPSAVALSLAEVRTDHFQNLDISVTRHAGGCPICLSDGHSIGLR